jgi:hypothetical protein
MSMMACMVKPRERKNWRRRMPRKLRAFWAKHPRRAPGDAEAVIAGAWRDAKATFARNLSDEHLRRPVPPWRKDRGVEEVYV